MARSSVAPGRLSDRARQLEKKNSDYDDLLRAIGEVPVVMVGEATHGTREFYMERMRITKRLIMEKNFKAVAVEADWPDAYRINRYVRETGGNRTELDAVGDFKRFPRWMWRNEEMLEFVRWLRDYNARFDNPADKVGFYGLDLYSLYASIEAVCRYLDEVDPEAARRARQRYECFESFGKDPQSYGYGAELGLSRRCEDEVVSQLQELQQNSFLYLQRDGFSAEDELFFASQNARVVREAEKYYRSMFQRDVSSWNVRDTHMAETLEALRHHLRRWHARAPVVVWEHNSHIGDAQATEMGDGGQVNIGQLMRESLKANVFLIGFSTYSGTVAAASEWDGEVEQKQVRPALPESYEHRLHETGSGNFYLLIRNDDYVFRQLEAPRLERAIGVIYLPESERTSHYFYASMARQFDAVIHIDESRAVTPLDRGKIWHRLESPETFPYGL